MSRRNGIIVSANPHEQGFVEGTIGAGLTLYPGTLVEIDTSIALVGGRHTWRAYTPGGDGQRPAGPAIILLEDNLQGKLMTQAYTAGDRCFGYIPEAGDELNLLVSNVSGTATIPVGTMLIPVNASGEFIVTASTPEWEPARTLEDFVDVAADGHVWCIWTGY